MSDVLGYIPIGPEYLDGLTWRQEFVGSVSNNPGFKVAIIPGLPGPYEEAGTYLYEAPPGNTLPGPICVQGYNCPGDPVVIVNPPGPAPGTNPVPEPGTEGMFLMGGLLIAIGMKRWRR